MQHCQGYILSVFKDKYDIRNKLVSHESSKLFKHAAANLTQYCLKNNLTLGFEDKIIFIADHIINALMKIRPCSPLFPKI